VLNGTLEDFGFESYLGLPHESETAPPELHAQMEARLKMGTKPQTRGFL
jgi:proteasome maturation protein